MYLQNTRVHWQMGLWPTVVGKGKEQIILTVLNFPNQVTYSPGVIRHSLLPFSSPRFSSGLIQKSSLVLHHIHH